MQGNIDANICSKTQFKGQNFLTKGPLHLSPSIIFLRPEQNDPASTK